MVGDGRGSQFMHMLRNALHLTLQARCHHCPGCHFELKQVGFTATYRPRQCLLTPRNTFFSIFRAGLLEPHGSEPCTWHNRDLIRTHACADATLCVPMWIACSALTRSCRCYCNARVLCSCGVAGLLALLAFLGYPYLLLQDLGSCSLI
jgi:hypothetical protein